MASISMRSALPGSNARLVASLDIGTSKVTCLIAQVAGSSDAPVHVLGLGHYRAQGVRSGQIVNMEAAQHSILHAVSLAEEMADTKITDVHVNLSSGLMRSSIVPVELPMRGEVVEDHHIRKLLNFAKATAQSTAGSSGAQAAPRHAIHAIPLEFMVDGERGIRDPRGMVSTSLGAPCHVITTTYAALQNLSRCLENCHLAMRSVTCSPLAAAQASLSDDERDLGTILIDMGGGTTSFAVYHSGAPVYAEILAVGGRHVTGDIANVVPTTLLQAEKLKTSCGRAFVQPGDERHIVEAPTSADKATAETRKISVSFLNEIIQARVEETLEMVAERLEAPQIARYCGRRVVLTGGGALLPGIKDVTQRCLGREVRIAQHTNISGVISKAGPELSTVLGLAQVHRGLAKAPGRAPLTGDTHTGHLPANSSFLSASRWSHPLRKLFGI